MAKNCAKNKNYDDTNNANLAPKVLISSAIFTGNGELTFLVDSGSTLSFVKKSKIKDSMKIDTTNILEVNGLPIENIKTLGTIFVKIAETKCIFNVLDDKSINLEQYDGILGRDFAQKTDCDILLSQNCLRVGNVFVPFVSDSVIKIPGRSRQLLSVNIKNFEKQEGLISSQNFGSGIYIGNAIVKNDHGRAYFYGINTNTEEVEIKMKNVHLKEFKIVNKKNAPNFDTKILDAEDDTNEI